MRHRKKGLVVLLTICMVAATLSAPYSIISSAEDYYRSNVVYDASEDNVRVQSVPDSYNGYKIHPFAKSDTWLADNLKIGDKNSLVSYGEVAKGDKMVIEFKKPIDSKKFDFISVAIKHVPGNTFQAYNVSDDILTTPRKTFTFGTYELEHFVFQTASFANEKGMVEAIMLVSVDVAEKGQMFVDGFSLGNQPYKANVWYDATTEYLKLQSALSYKGLAVLPFAQNGTFWSEEAKVESDEGYAMTASTPDGRPVGKGDVLILEFVHEIKAEDYKYINLSMVTSTATGAEVEFYNVNEIANGKLGEVKETANAAFWCFSNASLKLSDFANKEGYVEGIAIKVVSDKAETFSVGGFSLTNKESSVTGEESPQKEYKLNVLYDASDDNLRTQGMTKYKDVTVIPFTERTEFWAKEAKIEGETGYSLTAHRLDDKAPRKGDVMILEFVTPIKASTFEVLNLSLITSTVGGAELEAYSVYEIKDGKLGPVRQRVAADFWAFRENSIALSNFADGEGYVEAIALKITSDEAATFSVGGFSLTTLASLIEDGQDILDNKIQVSETENAYEFFIELNKTGSQTSNANEKTIGDMIAINGVKVSDINKDGNVVKVEWQLMGRYYLHVTVDKDYAGEGAIINADKFFVGNCIQLQKGLAIPNGDTLANTYNLHVYLTDNVTDIESDTEYAPVEINGITSTVNASGDLMISVRFNNSIAASTVYYACNPDSFNRKDLAALNDSSITYYDPDIAKAFILGGYKSSILDNLIINDHTVAEWLAIDQLAGSAGFNTAIMVHYGMEGNRVMTIVATHLSEIGNELVQAHEDGDLSITFKEGLKFTSGKALTKTSDFAYQEGVWKLQAIESEAEMDNANSDTTISVTTRNTVNNIIYYIIGGAVILVAASAVVIITIMRRKKHGKKEEE